MQIRFELGPFRINPTNDSQKISHKAWNVAFYNNIVSQNDRIIWNCHMVGLSHNWNKKKHKALFWHRKNLSEVCEQRLSLNRVIWNYYNHNFLLLSSKDDTIHQNISNKWFLLMFSSKSNMTVGWLFTIVGIFWECCSLRVNPS